MSIGGDLADGGRLAQKSFWEEEHYWAHLTPPCRIDGSLAFDLALADALVQRAALGRGERVLEVGCAPGKWLVFCAERFGTRVEGIEYSAKGAALTRENLRACGVAGTVHEVDFFDCDVQPYDTVLSFGFIEHFEDLEVAFARHIQFVAPGGRLVIGVPNFTGLTGGLQRWADPSYLALHNVRAMDPGLYRTLAHQHGFAVESMTWVGGFDPVMIRLAPRPEGGWRRDVVAGLTLVASGLRRVPALAGLNASWLSSYLLVVMRADRRAAAFG
jgi:SAM-dependent methyltransferase